MEGGQGEPARLQLTLTLTSLLLRCKCKLLCQKLMETMGLLVLWALGASPGPCLGEATADTGPILGEGEVTLSFMLSVSTALQLESNKQS